MEDELRELYRILQRLDERLTLSELEGLSLRVRRALQFLEQKFPEGVSLRNAAEHVRMHPASLCKKIRKELDECGVYISTREYLAMLRASKAKEFIHSDPFLLIKSLSPLVGTGTRNLAKIFERYVGKTPTEYRNTLSET